VVFVLEKLIHNQQNQGNKMIQATKYRRRLSAAKSRFPTRIIKDSGNTGRLEIGEKNAASHLEQIHGIKLRDWIKRHTRFEWVWKLA